MTEDEAITILIGHKSEYEWDERLLPRTVGASMLEQSWKGPYFTYDELYTMAKDPDKTEVVRSLSAQLFVAEKRLAVIRLRLYRDNR